MDSRLLIHVGSELVLLGGIVVYFNKQISELRRENEDLKGKLQNMGQALTQHSQILTTLIENHPELFPQNHSRTEKSSSARKKSQRENNSPSRVDLLPSPNLNSHNRVEELDSENEEDEASEEVTEERLDEELKKTYNDLHMGENKDNLKKSNKKEKKEEKNVNNGENSGNRRRIIRKKTT